MNPILAGGAASSSSDYYFYFFLIVLLIMIWGVPKLYAIVKENKQLKLLLIFMAATFILGWVIGVLRFYNPVFQTIFKVLFFPFSLIILTIEERNIELGSGSFFRSEIFEFFLFCFLILLQGVLYYFVIKVISGKIKVLLKFNEGEAGEVN
ncbi:MAG: hypothetical protein HYY40_14375 [Bacteroidetes bacterium]|nr:hypothetical protein [Bacteroidota bacterium]